MRTIYNHLISQISSPSTQFQRADRARWAFGLTFPGNSHLFSIPLAANGTLSLFGSVSLAHAQIPSYGQ